MAVRKNAAKPVEGATPRWLSPGSDGILGPAEQIAHDILAERRDLLPSVERIMTAGLATDDTLKAIGLFRDALASPDDVRRDPRVAIAEAAGETVPVAPRNR